MASQITGVSFVCSAVYSVADQRKHQSPTSLAFVGGIHRWPVDSLTKGQWRGKLFPFDDVTIDGVLWQLSRPRYEVINEFKNTGVIELIWTASAHQSLHVRRPLHGTILVMLVHNLGNIITRQFHRGLSLHAWMHTVLLMAGQPRIWFHPRPQHTRRKCGEKAKFYEKCHVIH